MSDKGYNEKEEEKQGEKEEKSWDEKWRRDPLSAVVWAGILIWAGLVFLAENLDFLGIFDQVGAWGFIFMGAGLLVLAEAAVRVLIPEFRRPITGTIIWGVILLAIGLGNIANWGVVWPVVLIIIGVSLLFRGFFSGR
jgi:hypothetical protein